MANLSSLYRFAKNDDFDLADLRQSRREVILDTLAKGSDLLVVHDVTLLDYSRHLCKKDRRPVGDHRGKGYEYVSAIGVDPQSGRMLGTLHDTLVNDQGPDDTAEMDYDYEPLFDEFSKAEKKRLKANHRHQMAVHINGLAQHLGDYHAIHVSDMEFDDLFVMGRARPTGHDYLIRTTAVRCVQVQPQPWMDERVWTGKQYGHPLPEGYKYARLDRLVECVPLQDYKSLALDKDGRLVQGNGAVERWAKLKIGSLRVRLFKPAKRNGKNGFLPCEPLDTNVVVVRETDAPEGQTPLCWVLFTSLEVDSFEQMKWVAYLYELRWKTEVYYRLLKSGYRIESLRLDNAQRIARWLVVVTIALPVILGLKSRLGLPESGYLDDEQYQRVKNASKHLNDNSLDPGLRLYALIAVLGGWLGRRRDPIGPTILMRGMLKFLSLLELEHYAPLIAKLRSDPQLLKDIFCV